MRELNGKLHTIRCRRRNHRAIASSPWRSGRLRRTGRWETAANHRPSSRGDIPPAAARQTAGLRQTNAGSGPVRFAGSALRKRSRSFSTSTTIVAPATNVPARIALAIGVSSSRWMARLSGRAP